MAIYQTYIFETVTTVIKAHKQKESIIEKDIDLLFLIKAIKFICR